MTAVRSGSSSSAEDRAESCHDLIRTSGSKEDNEISSVSTAPSCDLTFLSRLASATSTRLMKQLLEARIHKLYNKYRDEL